MLAVDLPSLIVAAVSAAVSLTTFGLAASRSLAEFVLRPKLSLELERDPDDPALRGVYEDRLTLRDDGGAADHWLRARVRNRGRRAAEDVQLVFLGGSWEGADRSEPRLVVYLPLRWGGAGDAAPGDDPLGNAVVPAEWGSRIAPGFFRFVNLVLAGSRAHTTPALRRKPRLCFVGRTAPHLAFSPQRNTVYLAVTATNADTVAYRVVLSYDGGWSDEPGEWWGRHFRVVELREVDPEEALGAEPEGAG